MSTEPRIFGLVPMAISKRTIHRLGSFHRRQEVRPDNLTRSQTREATLADPHQVNTIIAAAICDCRKDHPEGVIDSEEAKTMAKCIIQHLTEAGFRIGMSEQEQE
jgi:hypothetical protein